MLLHRKNLLKAMLKTPGLEYLLPLNEQSGVTANDISGNGLNGTYSGPTLYQPGPNPLVPVMASFDGLNDTITPAAGCSCRGKSVFTWVGVIEVVNGSANQYVWFESVADSGATNRFSIVVDADKKLNIHIRTGLSTQTLSSFTTTDPVAAGKYLCVVLVDIANKAAVLYLNGSVVVGTFTCNWGTDTAIANTASITSTIGGAGASLYYAGDLACVGRYSTLLSAGTNLDLARRGGFA